MSSNLLDTINSYVTPDFISKASSFVGESPTNTSKAMSGITPTLLSGISNLASTSSGATDLGGLLSSGGHDGSILNNLSGLFSGGSATTTAISRGEDVLRTLYPGNKSDTVTSAISSFSGIGRGSASSLMALAASLVMGVIGKLRSTRGLNSGALATLLASEKTNLASAIPPGLTGVTSGYEAPGVRTSTADVQSVRTGAPDEGLRSVTVAPMEVPERKTSWWPLLLLLAAALALLGYLFSRGRPSPPRTAAASYQQVKLCGGDSLRLMSGSFNYNLARFLAEGNSSELPKTFVFDNLNFDSGTTNLTPASHQTVNDLVTVLKSCPTAQVQLAGHTDNTGDPTANQQLSQNRANAIKDMLVEGGVSGDRMTTMGYGEDKPVATNDTEDGKAKNRRTELVVLKK